MNQVLVPNKLFSAKSNIFQLDKELTIREGHYQVLHLSPFFEILDYADKAFHGQTLLIKHSR